MKNSKNKIVAAVICGMVLGSVGTSVVGNFQGKKDNEIYTASNEIKSSTSDKNSDAADTLNENSERGEKGLEEKEVTIKVKHHLTQLKA